jgi:hypothetical protein
MQGNFEHITGVGSAGDPGSLAAAGCAVQIPCAVYDQTGFRCCPAAAAGETEQNRFARAGELEHRPVADAVLAAAESRRPYRLPALSMMSAPEGAIPSRAAEKVCRVDSV